MPVRLNSSGGGSVTLDVPSTGSAFTMTLPAANGNLGINLGTAQASTSGTFVDFTGIPAGVRRVTVMFNNVSTNGSSDPILQIGTSGGFVTSGYVSNLIGGDGAGASVSNVVTNGVWLSRATAPTAAIYGAVTISNFSGNTWIFAGTIARSDTSRWNGPAGILGLPGVLDRVRITTGGGTDVFDAGSVNVAWEF